MCLGYWLESSERDGGTDVVGEREVVATWADAHGAGPRAITPSEATAAREFYRDALRGRQVWPTEDVDGGGSLWFLVGLTLIEVSSDARLAATPIVLEVDDAYEVAERCWDAGFTVRVQRDATGRTALCLVDPFGRRVDLAAREATTSPRLTATEDRR